MEVIWYEGSTAALKRQTRSFQNSTDAVKFASKQVAEAKVQLLLLKDRGGQKVTLKSII